MDFFSKMFTSLFRSSTRRYKTRAEAKVRQQTIGKVQGKVMRGMANVDQKMYKAQDNILSPRKALKDRKNKPPKKQKKKAAEQPATQQQQQQQMQPAAAPGAAAQQQQRQIGTTPAQQQRQASPTQTPQQRQMQARSAPATTQNQPPGAPLPVAQQRQLPPQNARPGMPPAPASHPQGRMQQTTAAAQRNSQPGAQPIHNAPHAAAGHGPIAVKQQEKSKMGKGKQNRQQEYYMVPCANCSAEMQPDWDICPYCGASAGQQYSAAPIPVAGMGVQPLDERGKTIALSLDELNSTEQRHIVGWIVAQNGNHKGEDFRIYDGKNVIGTAADCDIVITDPYLSAKHCTIRHENGNYQIMDLDSMNGTFINGKRTRTDTIIDNDTVRFGKTEFKFKALF